MSSTAFKQGNKVNVTGTWGPVMCIQRVLSPDSVFCDWEEGGQIKTGSFPASDLTHFKAPKPQKKPTKKTKK